ncbi:gluconate 2-dehydrogenase subunit 3 family protein [Variovorax sp. GT1P44]|uniref:gluconate 2-dehydrogenase subunit 3 family protein n=1 Tax=Variovorax sp. GT1P44 TaxID=3443742 RepID=UPI003F472DC3
MAANIPPMVAADQGRRDFLRDAGLGLVAMHVGGTLAWLSPADAHAAGASSKVLSASEVTTLEAFGEVLLPGAREAGISQFVDHHLGVDAADSLLMLRYMDWPAPYAGFYKAGLAALNALSLAQHRRPFAALGAAEAEALVRGLGAPNPPSGWTGIPASLFYFVVRSDAVDVVYGTMKGFERLNMPYMPHIPPVKPW